LIKGIIRSVTRLGRADSSIGFLLVSLFLMAPILAACGPSGGGESLAVGDAAPSFTLPTASGDQVSLSDYHGSKPVLLYFHMADG
jgi:hypothetical protein